MRLKSFLLVLILFFTAISYVYAENISTNETNDMLVTEVVSENEQENTGIIFKTGDTIEQKDTAMDDLFVFGEDVYIKADVMGDSFAAGSKITAKGNIKGSLRAAGGIIEIKSHIERNVLVAGEIITVDEDSIIDGNMNVAAGKLEIHGKINKDLSIIADRVKITGDINGNVSIFGARSIEILDGASIKGNVEYEAYNKAVISEDSKVEGLVTEKLLDANERIREYNDFRLGFKTIGFFTYLVFAMIAAFIFGKFFENATNTLKAKPGLSIIAGAGSIVLVLIGIILLLLSFIGILPAIAIALFFILILICDKIVIALYIARKFVKNVNIYLGILMGVALLDALMFIPFIEFFINLIILLFGTGALMITLFESIKENKKVQE